MTVLPRSILRESKRALKRRVRKGLPPEIFRWLQLAVGRRPPPPVGRIDFGDLGTVVPVSRDFGFDRGLPIDRYYIEGFLERSQGDIRGHVLEIGDDQYSKKYGGANISHQDVLHVHSGNRAATVVGELTDPGLLQPDSFDCMVVTQTLHLIYDMKRALQNIHDALKPGGVLLLTVPGITPIDRHEWGGSWYWSLTKLAAERLVGEVFSAENTNAEAYGNVLAATAFLQGAALEDVDRRMLDIIDTAYPVIVAVHARKAPSR